MNTNYPVIIDDVRFEHPSSSIISGPSMFFFHSHIFCFKMGGGGRHLKNRPSIIPPSYVLNT